MLLILFGPPPVLLCSKTIFEEQSEILRADPSAMVQIQRSPLVAKHGQHWVPTQVDEYLARCNY